MIIGCLEPVFTSAACIFSADFCIADHIIHASIRTFSYEDRLLIFMEC